MPVLYTYVQRYDEAVRAGADIYGSYQISQNLTEAIKSYLRNENTDQALSALVADLGIDAAAAALATAILVGVGVGSAGTIAALALLLGLAADELGIDDSISQFVHDFVQSDSGRGLRYVDLFPPTNLDVPRGLRPGYCIDPAAGDIFNVAVFRLKGRLKGPGSFFPRSEHRAARP